MRRTLTLTLLVAGFVAATSPVWADAATPDPSPSASFPGQIAVLEPTPSVTVPTETCTPFRQARADVIAAGLVPDDQFEVVAANLPLELPVGSQVPTPGSVTTPGAPVTLFPAVVPTVAGLTYPAARDQIVAACGSPQASPAPTGLVASTEPGAGSTLSVPGAPVVVALTPPVVVATPPPTKHHHRHDTVTPAHHHWATVAWVAGGGVALAALAAVGGAVLVRARPTVVPTVSAGPAVRSYHAGPEALDVPPLDLIVTRHPTTYRDEEDS